MAIAERGPRVGTAEAAAEPRHARAPFGCAGAATRTPVAEQASPRRTSASRQRDPLPGERGAVGALAPRRRTSYRSEQYRLVRNASSCRELSTAAALFRSTAGFARHGVHKGFSCEQPGIAGWLALS